MPAARYHWGRYVILTAVAIAVCAGLTPFGLDTFRADAAQPMIFKPQKEKSKAAPSDAARLPEHIQADKVDDFMAALSDEQVRRLLIEALKKQAAEEAAAAADKKEMTGIAGFIDAVRAKVDLIRLRAEELKSGDDTKMTQIPSLYTYLGKGERDTNSARVIISAIAVFLAAFFIDFLFNRYTAAVRRRIDATLPVDWRAKISALGLHGLLDLVSICVFTAAVLVIFYLFLNRTMPQRVLVATYLAAVLIVRAAHLLSRLLLAPRLPALRILPLGDETALYLHRWIMAIVAVGSFGLLTCGIFRLAGTPEATHFIMMSLVGLVLAFMFISHDFAEAQTSHASPYRKPAADEPSRPPGALLASLRHLRRHPALDLLSSQPAVGRRPTRRVSRREDTAHYSALLPAGLDFKANSGGGFRYCSKTRRSGLRRTDGQERRPERSSRKRDWRHGSKNSRRACCQPIWTSVG